MKRLWMAMFVLLVPCALVAAIGPGTVISNPGPECLDGATESYFEISVDYDSPDGETLRFVDISFGDSWVLGDLFVPPPQSIDGFWFATAYPNGNGVQWVFTRTVGPGGGLADGETAIFSFNATPVNTNENAVEVLIQGDVGSPTGPHEMSATLTYDPCNPTDDDSDDDDADDDDDWYPDDDSDDDTTDDDSADDDVADDDATDDDADDDTQPAGDDDDDDDGDPICGCG